MNDKSFIDVLQCRKMNIHSGIKLIFFIFTMPHYTWQFHLHILPCVGHTICKIITILSWEKLAPYIPVYSKLLIMFAGNTAVYDKNNRMKYFL